MATLFVEYRIRSEHVETYRRAVRQLKRDNPGLTVLESADDPGLYVEIWANSTDSEKCLGQRTSVEQQASTEQRAGTEQRASMDQRACFDNSGLAQARMNQLALLADGGAARVRCWTFNEID